MKKFYTLLAAMMIAMTAIAQAPQRFSRENPRLQHSLGTIQTKNLKLHKNSNTAKAAAKKVVIKPLFEVITEAPEGEQVIYQRSGFGWATNMLGTYIVDQNSMACEVTYCPDGKTVYIKDILSGAGYGSYVKGEISADGSAITVKLGQLIYYDNDWMYGEKLAMLDWDDEAEVYIKDESATTATFLIQDGALVLQDTDNDFGYESINNPTRIFGTVYEDVDPDYDEFWAGAGDTHTILTPAKFDIVEAPEDLVTEKWLLTYDLDTEGGLDGRIVKAGAYGDEFYVQGLNDYAPETWVKGTIADGKISFANGQYLGMSNGIITYLFNAKSGLMYDEFYDEEYVGYEFAEEPFTFNYDAEAKTLQCAEKDYAMLVNAGDAEVYFVYSFLNPNMCVYQEVAGIPSDPTAIDLDDAGFDENGYSLVQAYIPLFDVNGNFMDPDMLTYKLYIKIDGEIEEYVFYCDEHELLTEDMVEIPYNFTEDWDFYIGASAIYIYQTGFDAIGIQSISYCGGERNVSNIVWNDGTVTETATDAYDPTGISNVNAGNAATIYDLSGRKLGNNAKGLVIVNKNGVAKKAIIK